jgi:phosphoribosylglycinamide formyltransferase-1
LAVLASGEGTTAEALIRAGAEGEIGCEVGLVVVSSETAGIFGRVERLNHEYGCNVAAVYVGRKSHPPAPGESLSRGDQTVAESIAIEHLLAEGGFDLIVLMGYLKRAAPSLVHRFGWRSSYSSPYQAQMLNIHPGPLPETKGMYGIGVQEHVLEKKLPYAAHVVQVVGEEYDDGPIVAEHRTPVLPGDTPTTLSARVKSLQKEQVPWDIGDFVRRRNRYLEARQVQKTADRELAAQAVWQR